MRGLDSRYSEVCLQMIFNYKMNDKFDSSKHFYQNVCHTLLSMILPVAIDKNPLHFKSKLLLEALTCREWKNSEIDPTLEEAATWETVEDNHLLLTLPMCKIS
jgi:hypothetical protein